MDNFIHSCFEHGLLPQYEVTDRNILEVGSLIVNGTVRPTVEKKLPKLYIGVDIMPGPGVDKIVSVHNLYDHFGELFDVVIATELVEHVQYWRSAFKNLVLTTSDILIITTRSPGFPYHGHPHDYWRYTVPWMESLFSKILMLDVQYCLPDIEYPGVIIKVRKPDGWNPIHLEELDRILDPDPVPQPQGANHG